MLFGTALTRATRSAGSLACNDNAASLVVVYRRRRRRHGCHHRTTLAASTRDRAIRAASSLGGGRPRAAIREFQRRQGRRRRVGGLARGAAASSSSAHLGRLNVREAREVLRLVLHSLGLRVDGVLGALVLVRLGNVPGEREGRARAEQARATKSDDAYACVRFASSSESGGRGLPPRPAARHGEEPVTRRRRVWRVGRR